jgi:hypothetical protein
MTVHIYLLPQRQRIWTSPWLGLTLSPLEGVAGCQILLEFLPGLSHVASLCYKVHVLLYFIEFYRIWMHA